MTTLTDFLLARIAEDYAEAARAEGSDPDWSSMEITGYGRAVVLDRSRAMSESDAKQRIVKSMSLLMDGLPAHEVSEVARYTLRYLALPYAHHSDYDEAWRV